MLRLIKLSKGMSEMLPKISYECTELTERLAEQLLSTQTTNREYSQTHVRRICDGLEKGEGGLNEDMIMIDCNGHMINGQHRCRAVIKAKKSMLVTIARGFPPNSIYVVDYLQKQRSGGDALRLEGVSNSRAISGALGMLSYYVSRVYVGTSVDYRLSPKSTLVEYSKHKGITNSVRYIDALRHKTNMTIVTAPVASFCHYAFSLTTQSLVDEFFEYLIVGADVPSDSIVLKLRNKLIKSNMSIYKINCYDALALTIKTWNIEMGVNSSKNLMWVPSRESFPIICGEPFKDMYSPHTPPGVIGPLNNG